PYRLASGLIVGLVYVFLLAPIAIIFIISFDTRNYIAFPPQSLSLGSYAKVLQNEAFIGAFWRSVVIGLIVGALAVVAGLMLSLAIVRHRFRGRDTVSAFVLAPLLVPHIVLAVG